VESLKSENDSLRRQLRALQQQKPSEGSDAESFAVVDDAGKVATPCLAASQDIAGSVGTTSPAGLQA
ncbi:hypothetical protein DIPPA_25376, partial [Diplonema papillatum]